MDGKWDQHFLLVFLRDWDQFGNCPIIRKPPDGIYDNCSTPKEANWGWGGKGKCLTRIRDAEAFQQYIIRVVSAKFRNVNPPSPRRCKVGGRCTESR